MYENHDLRVKQPTLAILAGPGELSAVTALLELAEGPAFICTQVPELFEHLDVPIIAPLTPDRGVAGALVTALAFASTEWVLVAGRDGRFVDGRGAIHRARTMHQQLARLWSHRHARADAICFEGDALPGLFRSALAYDWAPRLDGAPPLHALLDSVRADTLRDGWSLPESFSKPPVAVTVPLQAAPW